MAKSPIIDIHAHFYPEQFLKLLDKEGGIFGIRIRQDDPSGVAIR